jgi:hypothetical protein
VLAFLVADLAEIGIDAVGDTGLENDSFGSPFLVIEVDNGGL